MAPSPFRSTAVVCSIVTASLGFGLLTPAVATAAAPTPSTASSVAQDQPVDAIPVDPALDAPRVMSITDTTTGARAVLGSAGGDQVTLLAGETVIGNWPAGPGLFQIFAIDTYRDDALDLVRVHTAADGTKTRTERTALPRTLQVDGLREQNVFTPGTQRFAGTASAGATIVAADEDGTELFRVEASSARTAAGSWSAEADLDGSSDHKVTFTQTLPDGRTSVIEGVVFSPAATDAPAAPVAEPAERRLDGDFTVQGSVDERTARVEIRDTAGTSIGETRIAEGWITGTVPQDHLGERVDLVAIAEDGTESAPAPVELEPLPVDAAVTEPEVRATNVLPDGTIQVIGERQDVAGTQVLDGDRVVASIQRDNNGWSFTIGKQFTGKQLDLVHLGFDGQRYSATSERVALPRLLQVDGIAEENTYTPGERTFTGSAEAGAAVVATDQDGEELFRTEAKQTRSGVAEWEAKADLSSKDGYEVTFTQTTADGRTSVMEAISFTPQDDAGVAAPSAEGYFPVDIAQWAGIAGVAEVGAEVVVKATDGTEIGSTTVTDPSGTYNVGVDPTKVGTGVQEFVVTQTVDGTTSDGTSAELDYGQNAPTFTDPAEGSTIGGTDLRFDGAGTTGGTVSLSGTDFTQTQLIGTASVADGRWQIENDELDLPTGDYQFWASQRTRGGKVAFAGLNVHVQSASLSAEGYFPEDVAQWAGIAGISTPGVDVVARDAAGTEIGRTRVEDERGYYNLGIDPTKVGFGEQRIAVTEERDGVESDPVEVVLDYGTNAPTFTGPADGSRASSDDLVFTGTGDLGGHIVLMGVGADEVPTIGSAAVRDGGWTITNELELPDGDYQFWAHQRTKGGKIANTGLNVQIESNR
ncbi:hypothetical protein [Curtobacterium sp. RIT-PI-V]|uniref:hypothetical protein n=1 Tax=Curtobacterium sp. RIT-PI-V TaxID=3035296 RepID=UPI0021D79BBE|nr:hypothetical protein [Curtobacterium sp. RIT-PI-V]